MTIEVNPADPSFAKVRDAFARVTHGTQAAAHDYLVTLRATQFERLIDAVETARSPEQLDALVKICMSQNLAERAVASANDARIAVATLSAGQAVTEAGAALMAQTELLAVAANEQATAARVAVATLGIAEDIATVRDALQAPPEATDADVLRHAAKVIPQLQEQLAKATAPTAASKGATQSRAPETAGAAATGDGPDTVSPATMSIDKARQEKEAATAKQTEGDPPKAA